MPVSLTPSVVKKISLAVDALLTIWSIIRSSSPSYTLKDEEEKEFVEKLSLAYQLLSDLASTMGVKQQRESGLDEVFSKLKPDETLILVVSPSFMRQLVKAGVPREKVVAVGGPLTSEDVKLLNPNISEESVAKIEERLKSFWRELERKAKGIRTVLLVLEKGGKVDEMIASRSNLLSEKLGVEVKPIYLSGFEDQFISALPQFFRKE
ncbi:MAG: DUF2100 domain-containing protein [Candidatus Jordarchaeales archaeon]